MLGALGGLLQPLQRHVVQAQVDPRLALELLDQVVDDALVDEFRKEQGIDLRGDKLALQRLKEAAEKA